jgi:hypothetical protein
MYVYGIHSRTEIVELIVYLPTYVCAFPQVDKQDEFPVLDAMMQRYKLRLDPNEEDQRYSTDSQHLLS